MLEHATIGNDPVNVAAVSVAEQAANLEERLGRGWDLIARAEQQGESTDELFNHFKFLLRQYEDLLDEFTP